MYVVECGAAILIIIPSIDPMSYRKTMKKILGGPLPMVMLFSGKGILEINTLIEALYTPAQSSY